MRWFRFRHSFYTKKTWNEVMDGTSGSSKFNVIWPKNVFFIFDPKNHLWAFKNHQNVFYSSRGRRWTLKFCSSSIRSKMIGDHGFSSLFATWPDLRGQVKWRLTYDLKFIYQSLRLAASYTLVFFLQALAQSGTERHGGSNTHTLPLVPWKDAKWLVPARVNPRPAGVFSRTRPAGGIFCPPA